MTAWNITPKRNTTYTLQLSINDRQVYQTELFVETVERSIVDQNVQEKTVEITDSAMDQSNKEELRTLLYEAGYTYTPLELENMVKSAQEHLDMRKTVTTRTISYDDNSTETVSTVRLSIEPKENTVMKTVQLIEIIPKEVANHTDQLSFKTESPIILEEDPVIMWNMEGLEEEQTVSYEVKGETSPTGNTVVLAKEQDKTSDQLIVKVLLAILLIPIIVGLIIYFNRSAPQNKKN